MIASREKWAQWDAKRKAKTEETEEPINTEDEEDLNALDVVSASKSDETPSAEKVGSW